AQSGFRRWLRARLGPCHEQSKETRFCSFERQLADLAIAWILQSLVAPVELGSKGELDCSSNSIGYSSRGRLVGGGNLTLFHSWISRADFAVSHPLGATCIPGIP